eukprot:TRINITY_DN3288_c0_g1_i1.p1 TRINITY_DN3288_c0_g1~~TRINITY_DN3288_c0_g1_i1.p1  ORF type:complete len:343 (+),score=71.08 TRINITY_DN3288_c0_g1_i1:115-1029(+)
MDLEACLKILRRHNEVQPQEHADWARCCECADPALLVAPPSCGCDYGYGENEQDADGQGGQIGGSGMWEDAEPKSLPQGQVLDANTGVNESLDGLGSIEALFDELPELDQLRGGVKRPEGDATTAAPPQALDETALTTQFRSLDTVAVLEGLLAQHQRRVATHKAYDAAFKKVLSRGTAAVSMVYPEVVTAATQRFADISLHVRAATSVLGERGADEREAASLAQRLQTFEKEKLTLAAAAHLDRVRFVATRRHAPDPGPGLAAADGAEIRKRAGQLDVEIEETVSELRYALAEFRSAADEDDD